MLHLYTCVVHIFINAHLTTLIYVLDLCATYAYVPTHTYIYIYVSMYIFTPIHIYIYVCTSKYIYISIYIYIHIYIYACIYIYTCIYIYSHMYTRIYTHTSRSFLRDLCICFACVLSRCTHVRTRHVRTHGVTRQQQRCYRDSDNIVLFKQDNCVIVPGHLRVFPFDVCLLTARTHKHT